MEQALSSRRQVRPSQLKVQNGPDLNRSESVCLICTLSGVIPNRSTYSRRAEPRFSRINGGELVLSAMSSCSDYRVTSTTKGRAGEAEQISIAISLKPSLCISLGRVGRIEWMYGNALYCHLHRCESFPAHNHVHIMSSSLCRRAGAGEFEVGRR